MKRSHPSDLDSFLYQEAEDKAPINDYQQLMRTQPEKDDIIRQLQKYVVSANENYQQAMHREQAAVEKSRKLQYEIKKQRDNETSMMELSTKLDESNANQAEIKVKNKELRRDIKRLYRENNQVLCERDTHRVMGLYYKNENQKLEAVIHNQKRTIEHLHKYYMKTIQEKSQNLHIELEDEQR